MDVTPETKKNDSISSIEDRNTTNMTVTSQDFSIENATPQKTLTPNKYKFKDSSKFANSPTCFICERKFGKVSLKKHHWYPLY